MQRSRNCPSFVVTITIVLPAFFAFTWIWSWWNVASTMSSFVMAHFNWGAKAWSGRIVIYKSSVWPTFNFSLDRLKWTPITGTILEANIRCGFSLFVIGIESDEGKCTILPLLLNSLCLKIMKIPPLACITIYIT